MPDIITRHLIIEGRVQGVWYRGAMCIEAEALGITGWVRNRVDGTVEAMIQGAPKAVEAMIEWAWRGPERARVTDIEVTEGEGKFDRFEALRSA